MTEDNTREPTQAEIDDAMKEMEDERSEDNIDSQTQTSREMDAIRELDTNSHNQHKFLERATFENEDPIRTTFLHAEEAGRPDFSVRFLGSVKTAAEQMLDSHIEDVNEKFPKEKPVTNMIANYFAEKIKNITESGMSMEGFNMRLNASKILDTSRTRNTRSLDNLKNKRV